MGAALACAMWAPLPAQRPVVTIASNGIVRVFRTLPLEIPAGRSSHRLDLDAAIAGSVTSATDGIRLVEVRRDQDFDVEESLRASVGKQFELQLPGGATAPIRLIGVDPERWQSASGAVHIGRPGQILWPADAVQPTPDLLVTLESASPRTTLTLEYEVAGGAWAAIYDLRLGERATLAATAVLSTGVLRVDTSTTRLLAGDLGSHASVLPTLVRNFSGAGVSGGVANALIPRDQVTVRSMYVDGVPVQPVLAGQIYLYTLPEPVIFLPNREVAVPLLDRLRVDPVRQLSIGGAVPPRGPMERDATDRQVPVLVSYEIGRQRGTEFGDLPLPGGIVSVFDIGEDGITRLTGRTSIPHVAPGAPVQVTVGASFDVTATRTQMSYAVDTLRSDGEPAGATLSYRVVIHNAGDSAVRVNASESRLGDWTLIESSHPAERRSSTTATFAVPVPGRGQATLTYRLRVVW